MRFLVEVAILLGAAGQPSLVETRRARRVGAGRAREQDRAGDRPQRVCWPARCLEAHPTGLVRIAQRGHIQANKRATVARAKQLGEASGQIRDDLLRAKLSLGPGDAGWGSCHRGPSEVVAG